eukprot:1324229-Amorphochlora_amoeboformis.AAC.1
MPYDRTKPTQSSEREGLREKSCRRGADRSHLKAPSTSRSTGTTKKKRASTKVRKPKRPKTAYNFFQLSVHQSVWSEVCPDKTNPIDRVQNEDYVKRMRESGGGQPESPETKRPRYSRVEDHESDLSTEDKFSDSDMESDECALYEPQVFRDPQ